MITLKMGDTISQYDKSDQGAEDIILSIYRHISQSGLVLDSMDIDGTRIYSEYDKYVRENIGSITNIKVNLVTRDEFVADILHTACSYISEALPRVQPIIDSLYTGEKDAAIIDDLSKLLEGITWLFSVGREIIDTCRDNSCLAQMISMGYGDDVNRLEEAFNELKSAIMNIDYILIADILNYEILDVFNKMLVTMQKLNLGEEDTANMRSSVN